MKLSPRLVKRFQSLIRSKLFIKSVLVLFVVFLITNIVAGITYKNKTYPKSNIAGIQVGNKEYDDIQKLKLLKDSVELQTPYKKQIVALSDVSVKTDWESTNKGISNEKSWLPVYDYIRSHQLSLVINYDTKSLDIISKKASQYFLQEPVNWSISKSKTASLNSGKNGFQVDENKLSDEIAKSITTTGSPISVPLKEIQPEINKSSLEPLVKELNARANLEIKLEYDGQISKASPSEILDWYEISKDKLKISNDSIDSYVTSFGSKQGISVQNIQKVTGDINAALQKNTKLTATLVAAPKAIKKYTFCVRAKGISESFLPDFASKFVSTLNNPKGWALDGQVSFTQVSSGCDFTAWLSKASLVPSFGAAICDSTWSCSVPPNVIINYDRWTGASPAWNENGGSLSDYRNMVINHETGHWLDFRHRFCGGKGQAAPVMQQQSISLQGCKFNPWPTKDERDTLRTKLGL